MIDRVTRSDTREWVERAQSSVTILWGAFIVLFILATGLGSYVALNPEPPEVEDPDTEASPIQTNGLARVQAGQSVGAAFLVAEFYAISAAHVVGPTGTQVQLGFESGDTVRGEVVASGFESFVEFRTSSGQVRPGATEHDWAVIRLEAQRPYEDTYPVGLGMPVQVQSPVLVGGYPGGGGLNVSSGIVSSVGDTEIRTDAGTDPGYSGGPVVLKSETTVVGVVVSSPVIDGQRANSVTNAIPITTVIEKAREAGVSVPV